MKRVLIVLLAIVFSASFAIADPDGTDKENPKENQPKVGFCPITKITEANKNTKCTDCHGSGKNFKIIKETKPMSDLTYADKPFGLKIDDNGLCLYEMDSGVTSASVEQIINIQAYFKRHPELKDFKIAINNQGGGVFYAWRIRAIVDEMKKDGIYITTVCDGYAFSAAFLLLQIGDKRIASKTAFLMWHEAWKFERFKFDTVSSLKEDTKTMELFQDTANDYIAERCNLTGDEIQDKISHKEWWLSGEMAFELGLVDEVY